MTVCSQELIVFDIVNMRVSVYSYYDDSSCSLEDLVAARPSLGYSGVSRSGPPWSARHTSGYAGVGISYSSILGNIRAGKTKSFYTVSVVLLKLTG